MNRVNTSAYLIRSNAKSYHKLIVPDNRRVTESEFLLLIFRLYLRIINCVAKAFGNTSDSEFDTKPLDRSDAELLRGCRNGDQEAWDALVERFQRLIITIPRQAGLNEELAADIAPKKG